MILVLFCVNIDLIEWVKMLYEYSNLKNIVCSELRNISRNFFVI